MSAQTEALRAALKGDVIEVVEECGWITTLDWVDGEPTPRCGEHRVNP